MFSYGGTMVGDPKTLFDLHRVEAQVRATCTSCKATEVWELAALIEEVKRNGGNTDWCTARYAVKCPRRCPAPMIELLALPFGKRRARRRDRDHALVNLSLQILHAAAYLSNTEPVGTLEVRLALHVLRPFLRDSQPLVDYWKTAIIEQRHPWATCHLPYRLIVSRLVEAGAPIDDMNRP